MAKMWIGHRWTDAQDGRVFEVRNPATEEVLDSAPRASPKPYWYPYRYDRPKE